MTPISLGSIRSFPITVPRWAPVVHAGLGLVVSGVTCAVGYQDCMGNPSFARLPLQKRIVSLAPKFLLVSVVSTSATVGLGFVVSIGIDAFARLCGRISAPRALQVIGIGVKNFAHSVNPIISILGILKLLNKKS